MRYLPIDVSSFKRMISGNYIYVDKTEHIYNLFSAGIQYYFLSRPRRFGKSLLISTLKEFFSGNKELFKDLWVGKHSDYDWQEYPVVHLDFSSIDHETAAELKLSLVWNLKLIAQHYGIDISEAPTLNSKFTFLVQQLAKKNKVVILIDEYDKPVLDHIQQTERAKAQQTVLKGFYDAIKGLDAYLRAVFITGVTKFSKTSIFSGINNLVDITMEPQAATLLGYTKNEIERYFVEFISQYSNSQGKSHQEVMKEMEIWYNGYRFSREDIKVYNPYSILNYLQAKHRANYWFASGTPSFLIHLLKTQYLSLESLSHTEISADNLGTFEIGNIPLITLLFQTGYLTIRDYNKETGKFLLGYPNYEVEESFIKYLVASLAQTSSLSVDTEVANLTKALEKNDLDTFCSALQTLLAHIPYTLHINKESYYHSLFQFLMTLLSLEAQSEILTNIGRIDAVVITETYIYIFELKFNESSQAALNQILSKKYYERYRHYKKIVVLVGLSFKGSKETTTVECTSHTM